MFCAMLGKRSRQLGSDTRRAGRHLHRRRFVPRLGDVFAQSDFRARFEDKGRYLAADTDFRDRATALLGAAALLKQP
jgi:glucokinase